MRYILLISNISTYAGDLFSYIKYTFCFVEPTLIYFLLLLKQGCITRATHFKLMKYIKLRFHKGINIRPQFIQMKDVKPPCFVQMRIVSFCFCYVFSTQAHRHFLRSWLNTDGSCSSGGVNWPFVVIRVGLFLFYAAINFILTRVRGQIFPRKLRGAVMLLAPMWLMNIISRSLYGAVFVTLRDGGAMATNYPPPPSQGQGWWVCHGSCSLDLLSCALPFLCQGDPCPSKSIRSFLPERTGGNPVCHVFPVLYYSTATTPKSFFLCGLTDKINAKPRFITISTG